MYKAEQRKSSILLESLAELVSARMGLNFPPDRWRDLQAGVQQASRDFGYADVDECVAWLLSSPLDKERIRVLARYLTIGETYFFRDPHVFRHLEEDVLLPLVQARRASGRSLRIWCAGCASGEEPYSLAILLERLIADLESWDISFLATDVNPLVLEKAARAVYRGWSFRNSPPGFREGYFQENAAGEFQLAERIRKMVDFHYLNLAEEYPSHLEPRLRDLDLIICRNVLLYFRPRLVEKVLGRFRRILSEKGWLVVSSCEHSQLLSSRFLPVHFTDALFYRKKEGRGLAEVDTDWPRVSVPDRRGKPSPEPADNLAQPAFAAEEECMLPGSAGSRPDSDPVMIRQESNAGEDLPVDAVAPGGMTSEQEKMNPLFHYVKAMLLQENGEIDLAISSLRRCLYLNQDFILAAITLGNLLLQQGKGQEARLSFTSAGMQLKRLDSSDTVPEAEGMTAGRLLEIVELALQRC